MIVQRLYAMTRWLLRHPDLITQQNLGGIAFPTPVTTGRDHVAACIINKQLGDSSCSMTRYDQERNCRMTRRRVDLILQIIEPKDIVRGTIRKREG
jgi:hypothetical protein